MASGRAVVAIVGPAGAGKKSLAAGLAALNGDV
jgi:cytidylate kinase